MLCERANIAHRLLKNSAVKFDPENASDIAVYHGNKLPFSHYKTKKV